MTEPLDEKRQEALLTTTPIRRSLPARISGCTGLPTAVACPPPCAARSVRCSGSADWPLVDCADCRRTEAAAAA